MNNAIKTPFEGAGFERLVVKLKEIIRKETGDDVDEECLGAVVYGAAMVRQSKPKNYPRRNHLIMTFKRWEERRRQLIRENKGVVRD
jgi:hypothetical protein